MSIPKNKGNSKSKYRTNETTKQTNIDISLIESSFLFCKSNRNKERPHQIVDNPDDNPDENPDENPNIKSCVCLYDFSCINSILICNKIKGINYYKERFANIIEKYDSVKIGQLNEKRLEYITPFEMRNNEKCILLQYNSPKSVPIPFANFLFHLPNLTLFLFHVLDSYSYLLNSCILLESQQVCFFHLSSGNIGFAQNYKPLICNFQTGHSLLLEKCNENKNINANSYITQIIEERKDFTHTPIEVRALYFLIKTKKETLSMKNIEDISIHYTRSLSFLEFFSPDEKRKYYEECIFFLKKYIDMPKEEIIVDILSYTKTWDNFSLSILYLHIVKNTIAFFSLSKKSEFMNEFSLLLIQNISPNPMKRETLAKTHIRFETLYETYMDWNFIKRDFMCKNSRIQDLYEKILN